MTSIERSTPKVSTRRVSRLGGLKASSKTSYSSSGRNIGGSSSNLKKVERPPIVLEWNDDIVVRVGYAEQSKPQHILPLPPKPETNLETESQWYDYCVPIMNQIFDLLMINDISYHRLICVTKPYYSKAWESAFSHILWNVGIIAYTVVTYNEMIPMALLSSPASATPAPATDNFRGMIVHVGMKYDAHCMISIDGHALYFTYQVVPCGYQNVVGNGTSPENNFDIKIVTSWNDTMYRGWLDVSNPNSLMTAILKSLELCPTDVRKEVISNIIICGETLLVVPDLSKRIGMHLKNILTTTGNFEEAKETKMGDFDDLTSQGSAAIMNDMITCVPINIKLLKPLKDHVGIISCAPYRVDLISWIGTSIWSTLWYKHDQDDQTGRIQWKFSPTVTNNNSKQSSE